MSMNLKPFRDYSDHEVVNLFSTVEGNLTRGTFVSIVSFDPDNHFGYGSAVGNLPPGAHQYEFVINAKIVSATTATGVLGCTLFDVKNEIGYLNEPAGFVSQRRLEELGVVPSGKAVPVLKRGVVEIGGFSGTPTPGLKGVIGTSGSNAGQLVVGTATSSPNVGTFLSSSGKDGFAIFQVNCV